MKSSFQLLAVSTLVALSWGLGGCAGYRLGDVKPSSYVGINTLFIPPFKNETLEPRLSSLVTNAVLKEVQADGTYRVGNRGNSDAILVGVIKDVKKSQLRANRQDTLQSQELILYLYVDFHLEDPQTGAIIGGTIPADSDKSGKTEGTEVILARQGRVMGQTIQFVDPNFQVTERNSLAVAAQDLATKLVGQLANGW